MSSSQAILARRRAAEDKVYLQEMKLAEEFKLSSYATWETKTAAVIAKKTVENRARQLANEDADDVGERRAAMQRLYESEMNGWKVMLANQEETLDERKERIRERAYLLKNQRESERKNFVKEMYDKQWRDACDDARSLDSQAIMDKLLVDRKGAVDYAQGDGKVKEAEEAERQAGIWKEQMRELDRKEAADQKKRHDRNVAMRNTLDEQCAMLNGKKRELKTRNFNNEMKELAQWKQDEEDEKAKQQRLLDEAHSRGQATKEFNLKNMGKDKIIKARTRQQDLLLLQYALEKETQEIAGEQAKKDNEKAQAQQFKKFLEAQMIREAEDTKDVDAYRETESNKIWLKRDAQQKAQDDARSHLMHEVDIGRKEQMRIHKEKEEDDRLYFLEQIALDKKEWDRQETAERNKISGIRQGVTQNMVALKNQMALRESARAKEEQEKYLLNKQMVYMEKQHQARLKEQAGKASDYHPRAHTQWYT